MFIWMFEFLHNIVSYKIIIVTFNANLFETSLFIGRNLFIEVISVLSVLRIQFYFKHKLIS